MAKKHKKYLKEEKYIIEEEISEIDFDIFEGSEYNSDNDIELGAINNSNQFSWAGSSCPIEIDRVINLLEKFKFKGCKFVEIMYHEDHIGYVFSGLEINFYGEKSSKVKSYYKKQEKFKSDWKKDRIKRNPLIFL